MPAGRLDIDISTKESRRARKEAADREAKAERLAALRADWAKAHGARPLAELLCTDESGRLEGDHVHPRYAPELMFRVDSTGQWLRAG